MSSILIPSSVKGLIFDLDGTLINSMPLHYQAYNHCLKPWSVQYPYDLFISRGGIPTKDTLLMIAEESNIQNFDVEKALGLKREFVDQQLDKIKPVNVVFEVMKKYHGRLPMSVGTGSNRTTVDRMFDMFKIGDYIEHSVTATDVQNFKPHPETFLRCTELMNIAPEDCFVFEDGEPGIQAALSAGMKVIDVKPYID